MISAQNIQSAQVAADQAVSDGVQTRAIQRPAGLARATTFDQNRFIRRPRSWTPKRARQSGRWVMMAGCAGRDS
jgi:hypothetical protein